MLSSNRTLRSIIARFGEEMFAGPRAVHRPDLLLVGGVSERHVLIEFKRPTLDITREHQSQATSYRDDLRHYFENIEIIVIGKRRDPASDPAYVPPSLRVLSYAAVVSRARAELTWLIKQLGASQKDGTSAADDA
jgi:hypothetical protein